MVISGGPDWRDVSFRINGTPSFYRSVADGARMANDLEANGYKVHFLYSMAVANFVGRIFRVLTVSITFRAAARHGLALWGQML